ncbi:MAG: TonB-dependent receptor [Elusimicrobiota bacterium]
MKQFLSKSLWTLTAMLTIAAAARAATIKGSLTDDAGKPLAGVKVTIPALQKGAATGTDGFFSLDVPNGSYDVQFRAADYGTETRRVAVTDSGASLAVKLRQTPIEIAPITITAKPQASSTLTTPTSVDVVEGRQLDRKRGQNVMDTIKNEPGVDVLTTGATLSRPVVEGLSEQNVVMIEDGVRHEVQPWGIEHAPEIDSLSTSRIEVLRGPASLLYGSDALGGVISVFKPDLPSTALGDGPLSGRILSTYDSMNKSVGTGFVAQGAQGDWGYRADMSQRESGNEYTPQGVINNTGAHELSGDGTIGVKKGWGALSFDYGHFTKYVELQEAADGSDSEFQKLDHDKASVKATVLTAPFRYDIAAGFDRANRREYSGIARDGSNPFGDASPVVNWIQNNYFLDFKAHHAPLGPLEGTIGLTGWVRDQTSSGPQPLIPSFGENTIGEFIFEELPVGPVSFSAGLRADQTTFNIQQTATDILGTNVVPKQTLNYSAVTGALGGIWHITEPLSFAVNVGRGYRNPIPFELFAYGVHEGTGRFEVGNPGLKAETSINTDASIRYASSRAHGELMAYHNTIDNFIYSAPASAAVAAAVPAGDNPDGDPIFQQTQGRAVIEGASLSGDVAATDILLLNGGLDVTRGRNTAINQPLPIIPADRIRFGAELHDKSLGPILSPYLGANVKYVYQQTRTAQDFPSDPVYSYALMGLSVGGAFNAVGNRLTVDAGVDNLMNVGYQDVLNVYRAFGIEMPGRNYFMKVSIPFGS